MFKSLDIQDHMEVVGSDDKHVGTVDHMEGVDRILLTKDDRRRAASITSSQSTGWITSIARFTSTNHAEPR